MKNISRTRKWGFIPWLVGCCIFFLVLLWIGPKKVGNTLAKISWYYVITLVILESFTEWGRALKWRWVLGKNIKAVKLFFLSKASGSLSPARIGEFAPTFLPGFRNSRVISWIVLDRIMESFATLFLGCLGVGFLTWREGKLPGNQRLLIFLFIATLFCIFMLLFLIGFFPRWINTFYLVSERKRYHKFMKFFILISQEFARLKLFFIGVGALTFCFTMVDLYAGTLFYAALGYNVSFWVMAFASAVHGLFAALPITPNACGIPYVVSGGIVSVLAQVPPEGVLSCVAVHITLVNLVFWSWTMLVIFSSFRKTTT